MRGEKLIANFPKNKQIFKKMSNFSAPFFWTILGNWWLTSVLLEKHDIVLTGRNWWGGGGGLVAI